VHVKAIVVLVVVVVAAGTARADLVNHELLRAHVDHVFAGVDVPQLTPQQREALYADRLSLMAGTLVPILGTWRVENKVFGGLRPAGVIFDWTLGGFVPLGLAIAALATSGRTRAICAWTALGLYASTRIGIMIIGNLHISAYNHAVAVHLGNATSDRIAPGLIATMRW
jgi:hypothetical protein